MLERIKKTWLYAIAVTIVTTGAISYGVIDGIMVTPLREEAKRLEDRLNYATEEAESLKTTLSLIKDQYDIPDTIVTDFAQQSYQSDIAYLDFENLNTIKSPDIVKPVVTIIERNKTTQILFLNFTITISTSNVEPDGKAKFNVGYVLPDNEIPESLQFDLYPSQSLTVQSQEGDKLFYVNFLAANPKMKNALIQVVALSALRNLILSK